MQTGRVCGSEADSPAQAMPKGGIRESRVPTAQPWKTDPNLRRFTVAQQEKRAASQALAERDSQSGFNVNPDYGTLVRATLMYTRQMGTRSSCGKPPSGSSRGNFPRELPAASSRRSETRSL